MTGRGHPVTADPGQSHYFEANGLRLHYLSWGRPDAETLILLHGIRGYARTWEKTASLLEDRYHVVALDQRGRGSSGWSSQSAYYVDDYIADLEALFTHLGAAPATLVGHSLGCSNALVFTARHPEKVRRLVIEDIGPGSSNAGAGASRIVHELQTTPAGFSSWDQAWDFWREARPNASAEAIASRVQETLVQKDNGDIVWRFDFEGIRRARLDAAANPAKLPDLWPCVEGLTCPTLLLRGSDSDFLSRATAEEMARRNPCFRLVEIPNATHYVHDDNFADFFASLSEFLR